MSTHTIKLLLVEDDPNFRYIIKFGMEQFTDEYQILLAADGQEGYNMWKAEHPDIIIADIDMPVMDGYEMVSRIRESDPFIPILYTSGRVAPTDVVKGYALGANNYIKKPCMPDELHAHIQALLKIKNNTPFHDEEKLLKIGRFTLDAEHATLRDGEKKTINLTRREAEIIQILGRNKGNIVKREIILERCWDVKDKDYFASRSLDTFITGLRKKLTDDPSVDIQTIKGVGVRLID